MRRSAAIAAVLLAAALLAAPALVPPGSAAAESTVHPTGPFITVEENGTAQLWPYTSRRRAPSGATLPINLVVEHDATFVRYLLSEGADGRWNVTESGEFVRRARVDELNDSTSVEAGVVIEPGGIRWTDARGSDRFTYVRDAEVGTGRWLGETAQLHQGTYLGARQHIRMYGGGSGRSTWTAIQVHREHWDWFRLRHTVDSVDRAQDRLEAEFRGSAIPFDIRRVYYANGGALDSDGWVTTIDREVVHPQQASVFGLLLGAVGASVSVGAGRRLRATVAGFLADGTGPRHLVLVTGLPLLILGVRLGAIAVETTVDGLSPKIIAAAFYPLLVLGSPAAAVWLGRGLDPDRAAMTAAIGFGAGIVADYAIIDIATLPIGVLAHRAVLVMLIATLAAAGATLDAAPLEDQRWNPLFAAGALGWIVALLLPLLDLV